MLSPDYVWHIIILTIFFSSHVSFNPSYLWYPASGYWCSRQRQVRNHIHGLGLRLDQSLDCCSTLSPSVSQTRQIIGQSLCDWVAVPIHPLEVLPGRKRRPVQATYPLLLGVLARVILWDSWKPLKARLATKIWTSFT